MVGDLDRQLTELNTALGQARRAVLKCEIARCDVEQLGRVRRLVLGFANTLDGVNADLARRAAELRQGGNSKPTDDAMNPDQRQPPGVEQGERDRGDVLDELPGLDDATKSGELSGRYSDIIAKALRHVGDEVRAEFYRRHQDLAETARGMTEHRFRLYVQMLVEQVLADCGIERAARQRRNRKANSWSDLDTGMWNLRGSWDPDTGARINSVLEAELNALYHTTRDDAEDRRTRPQMMADAVANLLCGTPTHNTNRKPNGSGGGGATVLVITNHDTADTATTQRTRRTRRVRTTTTTKAAACAQMGDTAETATPQPSTTVNDTTATGTMATDTPASDTAAQTRAGTHQRTTVATDSGATESPASPETATTDPVATGDVSADRTRRRTTQRDRPPDREWVHEYGDGTPIALSALARLLDDPDTHRLPVTVNEHGVVTTVAGHRLNHGRDRRLATWAQRFALRAMHRTCLIPGCDTPFNNCEIHHLQEWEHGGRTNIDNIAPLCVRHHHLVHAEGWTLRLDPTTRQLTITRPDGITETHPHTGLATTARQPKQADRESSEPPDAPGGDRRTEPTEPAGAMSPDVPRRTVRRRAAA